MDSTDIEALAAAVQWISEGRRVMLATVVHTWGSAPRPPGAMMAIRDDGHVKGSVSGGCIEDDLIRKVQQGACPGPLPETLVYGLTADEAHRFGLPCGGTLQLVIEPATPASGLAELLAALRQGRLMQRRLDLLDGTVTLAPADHARALQHDGRRLITTHGPQFRLIIIGAAQVSRYVANIALSLGYQVIVCDPREEYLDEWDIAGVQLSREMPDDLIVRLRPDPHCAVLTLTHDPKLDDMALLEALKSPAMYVGALGSRRNNERRRERLALFDLAPAQIGKLRGPVGLYLGSRTPPEIAVSIMAEITAVRNGVEILQKYP